MTPSLPTETMTDRSSPLPPVPASSGRANNSSSSSATPNPNPNALHERHAARRGPRGVPDPVVPVAVVGGSGSGGGGGGGTLAKDPGHAYARTRTRTRGKGKGKGGVRFEFFDQRESNAPFGYEHYVSLPPGYDDDDDDDDGGDGSGWPLVLFLHGAGESQQRGGDEEGGSYASIRHGVPKVILCYDRLRAGEEPCISIPPPAERLRRKGSKQPKNKGAAGDRSSEPVPASACALLAESFVTVSPSLDLRRGYGWSAAVLSALLDEVVGRYRVDADRVHVTGFSMGGYGTWDLALRTPHRFATIMPICGGGDSLRASHIRHIPHWVHHGELDDIVPVAASQNMVDALERVGAPDVRFTRYPDLAHDSWTAAYNNPDVYRWMLGARRQVRGDEKAVPGRDKIVIV